MKKILHISLVIAAVACIPVNAQKMSMLQANKLNTEINRVLQVFAKYSSFSPGDNVQEIPAEFTSVFAGDAWILNFLNPYEQDQKQISPEDYYRFIREGYAKGLNLKMHWSNVGTSKPIAADEGNVNFIAYLPVTVTAVGLYKSQKILNLNREFYAILGFRFENNLVSDVKILYVQAAKPILNYRFAEKSKLAFGLFGGSGLTRIYSRDIFTDENWDAWGEAGYQAGLKIYFTLNPDVSVYAGVGLSNYRSVYEITDFDNAMDSVIVDEQYKETDVDGDEYYAIIKASVTETNSLTYLTVPLGIHYSIGKEKLHFTAQAGFEFSFLLSSRYSATGNSDHSGYYPRYHVVLFSLPEYGFSAGPIDANGTWKLNAFNISAHVALGAEIKLHDNFFLFAGPSVDYGLTDLGYKTAKHKDDYLSLSGNPGKLSTFCAGIMLELIYKL
jgi:hypothetical protein